MKIEVIPVYKSLTLYVTELEKGEKDANELWEQYAIAPYWETLCQYAPMDLSERKPAAITNVCELKRQLALLNELDLVKLQKEFDQIVSILPNYDDDPIYVALYPISDENRTVKERQNGVVGASLFGNLIIQVNPLCTQYEKWVPYVFAHEYHHTVWGNYWFVLHGGQLQNKFIDSLLIDGEADSFALSLYPDLRPDWIFGMSQECEERLWKNVYSKLILQTDVEYCKYMFGQEDGEIPWCAGYAIGYRIIHSYQQNHKDVSFAQLIEYKPEEIYKESGYLKVEGDAL